VGFGGSPSCLESPYDELRRLGLNALATADLAEVASRFGRLLHLAGVPINPERAGRFAEAVAIAEPATTSELYWLARITMVCEQADIAVFDRAFAQVFRGLADPGEERGEVVGPPPAFRSLERRPGELGQVQPGETASRSDPSLVSPAADDLAHGDETAEGESLLAALSADERLRTKDFADLTVAELVQVRLLAGRLALATPLRRSRRYSRHDSGSELDVRATLRKAARTGGEPQSLVRRRRRSRPRRLVLLCDISGSMEPYSLAYLQLLVSAVGGAHAEAFVFATRLTRLTRALRVGHPDRALERAGREARDWSGGTRIGAAIKAFNDEYGRRGMARGAVVVVISDGWDSGDPDLLRDQMIRLGRLANRVVWVNPRKAAPGFLPSTRGMAAALPHVDGFVSGHNLAAVDEVMEAISGNPSSGKRKKGVAS
jgi:uncharacterized protein with von Willebrand factor type A (vWA) domain